MTLDLVLYAEEVSEFFRPPRWKVLARRRWRRQQQPADVARAMLVALRGEYEPLRQYGVFVSARSDDIETEIRRQVREVVT